MRIINDLWDIDEDENDISHLLTKEDVKEIIEYTLGVFNDEDY